MHNASINEEATEATNQRGQPSHHDSDATIIKSYMSCIKRVSWTWSKGCLPVVTKSSRSSNVSGPTPSIPSTSSTIVESNHNKQHNKAGNKSALKI